MLSHPPQRTLLVIEPPIGGKCAICLYHGHVTGNTEPIIDSYDNDPLCCQISAVIERSRAGTIGKPAAVHKDKDRLFLLRAACPDIQNKRVIRSPVRICQYLRAHHRHFQEPVDQRRNIPLRKPDTVSRIRRFFGIDVHRFRQSKSLRLCIRNAQIGFDFFPVNLIHLCCKFPDWGR